MQRVLSLNKHCNQKKLKVKPRLCFITFLDAG